MPHEGLHRARPASDRPSRRLTSIPSPTSATPRPTNRRSPAADELSAMQGLTTRGDLRRSSRVAAVRWRLCGAAGPCSRGCERCMAPVMRCGGCGYLCCARNAPGSDAMALKRPALRQSHRQSPHQEGCANATSPSPLSTSAYHGAAGIFPFRGGAGRLKSPCSLGLAGVKGVSNLLVVGRRPGVAPIYRV